MQAFNLTRLNFHSPYKVWIGNGSYKFLTDYGVQYRIEFVDNYIAIIVQKSNPKLNDILRDFDEFIGFFDTKPE